MKSKPRSPAARALGAACCAPATAFVLLAPPAQAQPYAPGEGRVQFSVLQYQDWQPGLERVRVTKPALALEVGLTESLQLDASAVLDTISGASPSYHNVAASAVRFTDRRKAGDARLSWIGARQRVAVGVAHSAESDYRSTSASLNVQFDSDDRNTTLSLGWGRSDDVIEPVNRPGLRRDKQVDEWLLGLTRVLSPTDLLQINLTHFRGRGYFSDPYKLLDLRPEQRRQTTVLLRWNHHLPALDASLRTQLRANADSFGPRAALLGLEWVQALPQRVTVTPSLRGLRQTAADFYRPPDPSLPPGALPIPAGFVPGSTLNSFDPRLGAFTAWTTGLKLAWSPSPGWSLEWKGEAYRQTRTPTPLRARWQQLGLSHEF